MAHFWNYAKRNPVSRVFTKLKQHKKFAEKVKTETAVEEKRFDPTPTVTPPPWAALEKEVSEMDRKFEKQFADDSCGKPGNETLRAPKAARFG